MPNILRLFNAVQQQRLLADQNSIQNFPGWPMFSSGDQWTIEYMALTGKGAPWEIVPTGSYAGPQIGIFLAVGTQLAFQNSFVANAVTGVYTGTLSCSDAAFVSAVTALTLAEDSTLSAYVEVKYVDADGKLMTGFPLTQIQIRKGGIQTGTVTVPPTEIAATQSWAANTFAGKERALGDGDIWNSPSGYKYLITIDDDGNFQRQRIN